MSAPATRPRFSIVTPNWNGRAYLRPCLDSVLEQNYPDLEYIVADGASTDGSRMVIEEYRDRLSTIICEPDNGHADALNKGFAASTGELMGWINSDDVILPGTLSFVARLFEARPDIEWITGRPSSMNADGVLEWMGQARPWSRLRFLAGDNQWIQQESTFWRRSLWERAGARLDTDFRLANDFELWCRFFRHAELHTVDRHLGCFRVRPGQRSIVFKARYESEAKDILKRELDAVEPEFRAAFGALLPDAPVTMDEKTRLARHAELAACDPPVIRPANINRKVRTSRTAPIDTRPFANALERARAPSLLERFKGIHSGQRCFIMGNGPSLNRTDLGLLEGETVFACNSAFLLFDRINWRPAYYTCVDSRVLPDRASDIAAMMANDPSITAFFPAEVEEHVGEQRRYPTRAIIPTDRNRFYFRETHGTLDNLPDSMFSGDIDQHVIQPRTVAITMLQIAAYMGFSEIFLIGCDTRYTVQETVDEEDGEGLALVSTRDDDANHFDPSYFGKGRKWHAPKPELMVEHYRIARQALEARGVKVFDATVGGALDVFDKVDFNSLFDPDAQMVIKSRAAANAQSESAQTTLAAGVEALINRAPARLRQPLLSLWRNRRFALPFAGLTVLAAAALASPPAEPFRPWLWPLALFAVAFAFTAAVAIKSRRLLMEAHRQLADLHRREASRELRFIELISELEDVRTQLEDIKAELPDTD